MFPYFDALPLLVHPLRHRDRRVSVPQQNPPATHARLLQYNNRPHGHDWIIWQRRVDSDNKFRKALSRSSLNAESKQHCLTLVRSLRVHKHLFLRTFEHLIVCCQSRHRLEWLTSDAKHWGGWGGVKQLARHAVIKERLLSFGAGSTCHKHRSLFQVANRSSIDDDMNDILSLLLSCGRKRELYKLARNPGIKGPNNVVYKESEIVIELLWKFLNQEKQSGIVRHLRTSICRMARESAYLPREFCIKYSSITSERRIPISPEAPGNLKLARMYGNSVVIMRVQHGHTQRESTKMFACGAILWKSLEHKNIVPLLGVVMEGSSLGLVSPFFKHGNIKQYLQARNAACWPSLARRWARDLARALSYIHDQEPPIVHGNIKGENVLVDDDGRACLADFSQTYSSDMGKHPRHVDHVSHSVRWKAPELMQRERRAKVTEKSDIYAFGCVLYEMVSGKLPFQGILSDDEIAMRVLMGERPNRPAFVGGRDGLWKVAEACWMHRPEDRPSAKRLLTLLR